MATAAAKRDNDFTKNYTSFWKVAKNQSAAEIGHVLLISRQGLGNKSMAFGNANMKALGPISCGAEGVVIAQLPSGGPLKRISCITNTVHVSKDGHNFARWHPTKVGH